MRRNRLVGAALMLTGGLISVVGSLSAWVDAMTIFGNISKSGIKGDGKISLVGGIIIIILGAVILAIDKYEPALLFSALASTVVVAVSVLNLVYLPVKMSNDYLSVSAGAGLYLTLTGGVMALAGCLIDRVGIKRDKAWKCPACAADITPEQESCASCGMAILWERHEHQAATDGQR